MFPKKRQLPLQGSLCRTGASPVPTVRRRLLRIARNSLWLSLTHYATPPFPQKSRSARLFGCKRPHDGSLSLPTFADCGHPQGLSLLLTPPITFHSTKKHPKRVLFVTYLIIFQLPFHSSPPYEERGSLSNPLFRFRGF